MMMTRRYIRRGVSYTHADTHTEVCQFRYAHFTHTCSFTVSLNTSLQFHTLMPTHTHIYIYPPLYNMSLILASVVGGPLRSYPPPSPPFRRIRCSPVQYTTRPVLCTAPEHYSHFYSQNSPSAAHPLSHTHTPTALFTMIHAFVYQSSLLPSPYHSLSLSLCVCCSILSNSFLSLYCWILSNASLFVAGF